MNHITQTLNTKLKQQSKSPSRNGKLLLDRSERIIEGGSWRSRMLDKVKECRDAIKNMMAFDRLPSTVETERQAMTNIANGSLFSANVSKSKTSASSIPNAVTFSSVKDEEYEEEMILMRNSTLNSNEEKAASIEANEVNDVSTQSLTNNTISSSLKSFLMLEKKVAEECLEEDKAFTIKKKISAEPFFSYTEGTAKFVWTDDTEDSFPDKPWNSFGDLSCSDISIENRDANITFCEHSPTKKNRTSSPIRNSNSCLESHFSI